MKQNTKNNYTVFKADISYFSGKLEAYMQYKSIPHTKIECDSLPIFHYIGNKTGIQKMPAIEMADGKWLMDTTPMMQWLEEKHPTPPVYPEDPALRFVALLIEDYSDEWLWRPAMWWRWVPKASRVALGRRIAKIYSKHFAIPLGFYFGRRQLNEWLWRDGVDKHNDSAVKDMLFSELAFLEPLLETQPFLLGSHPSIADFGYFGPFFRHFGNDPISAEVIRREGPNTYEWLARLWNARYSKLGQTIHWQWPEGDCWQPLLKRIAKDYLPYLHQNAVAFKQNKKRFDFAGDSIDFKNTVTTDYRVWCRQELQREFDMLSPEDKNKVEGLFSSAGGLSALHEGGLIDSGMSEQFKLPIDPKTVSKKPTLLQRFLGQPRN